MTRLRTDEEIDAFGLWLAARLPDMGAARSSRPDQSFLDRAWEVTRETRAARQSVARAEPHSGSRAEKARSRGLYRETLLPMAAADSVLRDGPVRIDSLGGEWSLTRESVPEDPEWQILKLKCREELIGDLNGRTVQVRIGEREFALGEINGRGVAESWVPSDLDLGQAIEVTIFERDPQ